ncbi:MAG TPA: DAK2 domain-containing protein [Candidatus Lachnoclostridium stercorigallinarum]|uniref:DAK2 domain-containing protein n=1 Tax=Candidatus Lachnoclostridium stercorigallinarum TaxID=2838634 RepID=A0A9D2GGG5_9FIRM|nr:DAK2 domain-containing protein [Candidatus Lachnoclostridium stercorigallinarum]
MDMKEIDASLMQKAFLAAAKGLEAKKEWINELNVFPVPDGDTGTNMTLTIMAAAREVAAIEQPTIENLSKAISSGSLRGARGNSGVILSQLFRGFTKELKGVEVITTTVLANAFVRGTETAYKAVMKPKEGTILTVARGMADKAMELVPETEDIVSFADQVIEYGDYVLSQTPEMLPVLKEAGVVDSGGQGLMEVLKGARDGLLGREVDFEADSGRPMTVAGARSEAVAAETDIRFGYCTEFIINLEHPMEESTEEEFKTYLESIGDSIVVVADDDLVKVHVHTNHPGLAFEKALTYGSLSRMKIDNMREEHHERLIQNAERLAAEQKREEEEKQKPRKPYGFIAVSMGDGMGEIFKGIGADCLIEGGQTMNPSTEDVLNAVDQVNADVIFVLPNNKNIILAAEQAAGLAVGKKLVVIPSKTVPQGITALVNFAPDLSVEENTENMIREMSRVKTAQITYAVRNTTIDGMEITQGDIMGIGDSGMLAVGKSVETTALESLKAMLDEDSELVTIYSGSDVSEAEGEALLSRAKEACPECEVELHRGGQPIYYYLISVE